MKLIKKTPPQSLDKINPSEMFKSHLDKIEGELEEMGLKQVDTNKYLHINDEFLELPLMITEVPSSHLGEYLNAYTQQKAYMRTLLGRVELMLEESRRKYFESSAYLYRRLSGDKLSETAKERIINADQEVKPHYDTYQDYRNKRDIISYSISNIEDIVFMLSREVTRRTGDFQEDTRNYNVSRK